MATRLWFPGSTAAPITPSFDTAWERVSEAVRRKLADSKGASAIAIGSTIGAWTSGQDGLDRQYVSTRMASGIVFDSGVTVTGQLMVREFNNGDNTDKLKIGIRVVSEDGGTVRATCLAVANYATAAEFINNVTCRNKNMANGDALTSNYTTVEGDRLVVELGYSDNAGSTPQGAAKWGENATDLPANETQTTDGAGWIELSNTITFIGEPLTGVPNALMLLGVGR